MEASSHPAASRPSASTRHASASRHLLHPERVQRFEQRAVVRRVGAFRSAGSSRPGSPRGTCRTGPPARTAAASPAAIRKADEPGDHRAQDADLERVGDIGRPGEIRPAADVHRLGRHVANRPAAGKTRPPPARPAKQHEQRHAATPSASGPSSEDLVRRVDLDPAAARRAHALLRRPRERLEVAEAREDHARSPSPASAASPPSTCTGRNRIASRNMVRNRPTVPANSAPIPDRAGEVAPGGRQPRPVQAGHHDLVALENTCRR